jgi:hypothetical protein
MEAKVQNLYKVAMDWGSLMRWLRRFVAWAKEEAALVRKVVQKAGEPRGWPRRRVPSLISEVGPLRRERADWRLSNWVGVRVVAVSRCCGRVRICVLVLLRWMPRGGPRVWMV